MFRSIKDHSLINFGLMKIAFVISIKIWGGVKTWMLEFGQALRERGHEVTFFSADEKLTREVRKSGGVAYDRRFGADYNPVSIRYFRQKFKEHQIDVTCMNIQKELRTAGIAAKILGIPVVQRIGLPTDINYKLDQRFAQKFLVDEILVTCQWMKSETLRRIHFIPEEKISVVYNSKPVRCDPRAKKENPVRFVMTSRPAVGKGHAHLIEAFHNLLNKGITHFTCDLYGEGPLKDELAGTIANKGLEGRIKMKGFSRNLDEALKAYDFGVLCSRDEGLPNTAIEYLSMALPCLTTRAGALPEIIRHGENGFLHDFGDVDTLTQQLMDCMTMEDEHYAKLSFSAHQTMAETFNLESNVAALERYFESCIARHKKTANV